MVNSVEIAPLASRVRESLGVQMLSRKPRGKSAASFDGVDQPRRGMVDRFTHHDDPAVAHRVQVAPSRTAVQFVNLVGNLPAIVARIDQIVRLQPHHFLEVDVGPILRRVDHGTRTGAQQRVGQEGVAPHGDERILPDHQKYLGRRQSRKPHGQFAQPPAQIRHHGFALVARAQQFAQSRRRRKHLLHAARVRGIHRNAELLDAAHRLRPVDGARGQHQVGCSAAIASILGFTGPPTCGLLRASGG